MVSAKASSTFVNNNTGKVSSAKYAYELEYLGKDNCVKAYKILSEAKDGVLNKDFINGEIFYNVKENIVQICVNTKTIYDSEINWNANLAPSKCNEKKSVGFRNYLNGLPGEGSSFELVFCK